MRIEEMENKYKRKEMTWSSCLRRRVKLSLSQILGRGERGDVLVWKRSVRRKTVIASLKGFIVPNFASVYNARTGEWGNLRRIIGGSRGKSDEWCLYVFNQFLKLIIYWRMLKSHLSQVYLHQFFKRTTTNSIAK